MDRRFANETDGDAQHVTTRGTRERQKADIHMSGTSISRTIDAEGILISRTDLKGNVTYVSDAFARALGYDVADLIGQPYAKLVPPESPRAAFMDVRST